MLDQVTANRAAQQCAAHQAEGSCCRCNGGACIQAGAFQNRAPCSGCSVAAHHGDRAAGQTNQRIHAHHLADHNAKAILEHHQNAGKDQEHDHLRAALFQQLPAGGITDACIEQQAEEFIERAVQRDLAQTGYIQHSNGNGKQHTAHHRRGDTELAQNRHMALDKIAQHQNQNCYRYGIVHI